ncbi:hypothetical protein Bpfe_028393 [Biomphalaria pfeifferi]|uniref:Uncharacterized protein n=1 Tax=Biomphalaria pfeifferi TaxID=112525 RepID=A0AAD8EXB5_BIOPF|nr:hypothetical protein Bpfe_028393 [Biomphalaria pfeifferi]
MVTDKLLVITCVLTVISCTKVNTLSTPSFRSDQTVTSEEVTTSTTLSHISRKMKIDQFTERSLHIPKIYDIPTSPPTYSGTCSASTVLNAYILAVVVLMIGCLTWLPWT